MATALHHLYPALQATVTALLAELDTIPAARRQELGQIAAFARHRLGRGQRVPLVFICTHNSRRSQMAQVWARVAATAHAVPGVETFSGGTEATAFDPRAVAALQRAGFVISSSAPGANPRYEVRSSDTAPALECFSKVYDQPPNPTDGFCAIMTCSSADAGCPVVLGAAERISLPYDDPKAADGTDQEAATYDERCRQIGREMLYALSRVNG